MNAFNVDHLDVERLLENWRWLCMDTVSILARNAFGDLFLNTRDGRVMWLDVCGGRVSEIANSEREFRELLKAAEKRDEWLAESHAMEAASRGLVPNDSECIGFKIPIVFAESATAANNAYIADLYEQVAFLGELHQQSSSVPDGAKIRLKVTR